MQHLAAAFTRSGRVKGHWDVGGLGGQPTTPLSPLSSIRATDEVNPTVPPGGATPNDGIALVPRAAEVPSIDDVIVQSRPGNCTILREPAGKARKRFASLPVCSSHADQSDRSRIRLTRIASNRDTRRQGEPIDRA
jgi:hypothetical protein